MKEGNERKEKIHNERRNESIRRRRERTTERRPKKRGKAIKRTSAHLNF